MSGSNASKPVRVFAPVMLCLIAAAAWGLLWLPVLWIEAAGVTAGYAGLALNLGALPGFLLVWFWRPGPLVRRAIFGAALTGLAVTLFATALATTDVVRAIVFFYLAPVWSTLIECLVLGRRWTIRNGLAILVSLVGILVIFRFDLALDNWRLGDLLALGSGLAWAIGTAMIFTSPATREGPIVLTAGLAAILFAAALAPLTAAPPTLDAATEIAWVAILSGSLYLVPILAITLWGATHLPPTTMSFVLTAEIITGVASSAWFLDQPFGLPELMGAVLIASGALIEIARSKS